MSNSPLVSYTKISPNKGNWNGYRYVPERTNKIDTITIHCVVGQCSVETLGNIFANPNKQASSNYGVGYDGRIGMYVEEKDRSWCTSSGFNDNRAITIEVACDTFHPYAVNDKAWKGMIDLVADICKRNNIKELKWRADKSLIGRPDLQNMTVHRWFDNKACPGEFLYSRHGQIAEEVNAILKNGNPEPSPEPSPIEELEEDGDFGPKSVTVMQRWLQSKYVDGVLSDQLKYMKKYYPSVTSVTYGTGGSYTVSLLQKKVGVERDGYLGPATSRAVQKWLNKQGFNLVVDGIWGPETSRAFQKYLNILMKTTFNKVNSSYPYAVIK